MNKSQLIASLKIENFSKIIIKAFEKVRREDFIPKNLKSFAYDDTALPLEKGATISQPYTIAFMLSLLDLSENKNQKILEIGSGSGYVLALISEITKGAEIYGIEIISSLAKKSKRNLKNYKNIKIINLNGFQGLPQKALFDRILVSASSSQIPNKLVSQLKDNGILVIPIRNSIFQIKKQKSKIIKKEFPGFVFVPLISHKAKQERLLIKRNQ